VILRVRSRGCDWRGFCSLAACVAAAQARNGAVPGRGSQAPPCGGREWQTGAREGLAGRADGDARGGSAARLSEGAEARLAGPGLLPGRQPATRLSLRGARTGRPRRSFPASGVSPMVGTGPARPAAVCPTDRGLGSALVLGASPLFSVFVSLSTPTHYLRVTRLCGATPWPPSRDPSRRPVWDSWPSEERRGT